jgi:hypothetical protein
MIILVILLWTEIMALMIVLHTRFNLNKKNDDKVKINWYVQYWKLEEKKICWHPPWTDIYKFSVSLH